MTARAEFERARQFLLEKREAYDEAVEGFRWPALTRFNWALDHFDALARGNASPGLLLSHDDGSLEVVSFDALARRSDQAANFLRARGVKRGDRLLLMLPNVRPLWEVFLAAIKLGVVVVPATTLLTEEDLAARVARGRISHVVSDAENAPKIGKVPGLRLCVGAVPGWTDYAEIDAAEERFVPDGETLADDPLLLYFTSGTTAQPKLVTHTHQSYPVGHLATMYWIGLKPGDVHLNISSPGWGKHAWSNFFGPWNAGATAVATNHRRFDAKKVLALLERAKVTTLCAPPTVWRLLIQEDLEAVKHTLRELVSAGEPLNPEVIAQVRSAWGLAIREGYGQTETTCQMGVSPGQPVKPGSMGRPMPGYRIVLLDAEDREVHEGEVALPMGPRPTALMSGYAEDPEKTALALGGAYYRTGDVAMRDSEGYYWYVGRADDVFKSSDYRISPFELESVLIEHPDVLEAAVVPSPDPARMSVPKAYVTLVPGAVPGAETALAILRYAREHLAPYKRVRRLEFGELPKTISGKIRRVELRKREEELRGAGARAPGEFFEEDFPHLKG